MEEFDPEQEYASLMVKSLKDVVELTPWVIYVINRWVITTLGKSEYDRSIFTTVIFKLCPRWSEWSEFGMCSSSCGGGLRIRYRSCINGEPGDAGCTGQETDTESCSTDVIFYLLLVTTVVTCQFICIDRLVHHWRYGRLGETAVSRVAEVYKCVREIAIMEMLACPAVLECLCIKELVTSM